MIRVAILTPDPAEVAYPDLWPKVLARLQRALEGAGIDAVPTPWTAHVDDASALRGYACVLPLLAWGYHHDAARWQRACATWQREGLPLANPAKVLAWNTDKRYLHDLAVAGVPVPESLFFEPGQTVHLPAGEVVVKPAVGAGSIGAQRFTDHCRARDHAADLQDGGSTVLVQPYDARVIHGETAMVFLGGRQSHAFTKGPMLPEPGEAQVLDPSGSYAREQLSPADPDFELWDVGHAAIAAAAEHLGISPTELLNARVDVIGGRRDPQVLELELVEPGLGRGQLDENTRELQQRRFALEVESALDRLGLGPLSHR